MMPWIAIACVAVSIAGCQCSRSHALEDGGVDAAVSAPDAASSADAAVSPDASTGWVAPDGGLEMLVCAAVEIPAELPCPVQDPSSASGCEGTGAIVFDGSYCRLAAGTECGATRGAFDTFEACAVACERAGYCNEGRLSASGGGVTRDQYATCTPPTGDGYCSENFLVIPAMDLTSCISLGPPWECRFESHWGCWRKDAPLVGPADSTAVLWTFYRRLSLLPFVTEFYCNELAL